MCWSKPQAKWLIAHDERLFRLAESEGHEDVEEQIESGVAGALLDYGPKDFRDPRKRKLVADLAVEEFLSDFGRKRNISDKILNRRDTLPPAN